MVYRLSTVPTAVQPVELQRGLKLIGLLDSSGYLVAIQSQESHSSAKNMSNSADILLKQASSYTWVVTMNYKYGSTN